MNPYLRPLDSTAPTPHGWTIEPAGPWNGWLDAIRVEGVRHEHWFGDGVRHHWLLLLARLVPPPVIASGTGRLTSLAAAPDRQLRDARSQRPSALTASTSARPGGCMRPAAIRASTLATFTADQLLRGRRGVYRCRK
jgi:hypothetical protein